jgi:hypothetical protein
MSTVWMSSRSYLLRTYHSAFKKNMKVKISSREVLAGEAVLCEINDQTLAAALGALIPVSQDVSPGVAACTEDSDNLVNLIISTSPPPFRPPQSVMVQIGRHPPMPSPAAVGVLHSSGDTDEPTPMWVAGDLAAH